VVKQLEAICLKRLRFGEIIEGNLNNAGFRWGSVLS
jgi:hypothetical protein